ncbi:general substrate transporter [Geopyxis carbonaria]|nr:general substrate transporter [Geopyxis carbonaria]
MGLQPFSSLRGTSLVYCITVACSSGFMLFGYDQGVFSGVIVTPYFLEKFNHPNASLLGLVNALFDIGGAVGAILVFLFGGWLGRKRSIMLGSIIVIIGAIIQATASNVGALCAGRIIAGVGVGVDTTAIPVWQAETAPPKTRGHHMALELVFTATGLFISQWTNFGLGTNNGSAAFLIPVLLQIVFPAFTILMLCGGLPESPRWLIGKGRHEEAKEVLDRLHVAVDSSVDVYFQEIKEAVQLEGATEKSNWKLIFSNGPTQNMRRVILACWMMSMQQLSGVNSITYYVPTLLLKFLKVSRYTSLWVGGLTSVVSVTFALFPVFAIDRLGRIKLLVGGAIGQGLCFVVVAALLATTPESSFAYGFAIIFFIYLYFAIFSGTWLAGSWLYPSEILPLAVRGPGNSMAVVCYWCFNFLVVMITPTALENIGYKMYIMYAIFNIWFAVTIWYFYPETKGKTLEEMDLVFARLYGSPEAVAQLEGRMGSVEKPTMQELESTPQHV